MTPVVSLYSNWVGGSTLSHVLANPIKFYVGKKNAVSGKTKSINHNLPKCNPCLTITTKFD